MRASRHGGRKVGRWEGGKVGERVGRFERAEARRHLLDTLSTRGPERQEEEADEAEDDSGIVTGTQDVRVGPTAQDPVLKRLCCEGWRKGGACNSLVEKLVTHDDVARMHAPCMR